VSDGSVLGSHGTFGWAISLPNGTRLATCAGHAFGHKPTSFRAEGYGMLSMLRFLFRLFAFCGEPIPPAIKLFTDNLGLLDRISSSRTQVNEHPNATLRPDWDVLRSIADTLLHFPAPKLEHVYGHQDEKTAYDDLDLPAQLNVDADALAGAFQYSPHASFALVPRLASNPVQLQIAEATVTSKYKQVIRKAATTLDLKNYIKQNHQWTEATFQDIEWTAHGQAIKQFYDQRTFIVKYIHNLLPTGKRVHKYDTLHSHRCPTCQSPHEDRLHLLRCDHTSRATWRTDLLSALRTRCTSLLTRESLINLLIVGIDSWLNDTAFPHYLFPSCALASLLEQQDRIGWSQLFFGRFGSHWRRLQDEHLRSIHNSSKHLSGSSWILAITSVLWHHVAKVWELRNKDRHGHDSASCQGTRYLQILRETAALYDRRRDVLARDTHVFHESFEHHKIIEKTYYQASAWLNTWRPFILRSIQDAHSLGLGHVRTIRSHFPPASQDTDASPEYDSDDTQDTGRLSRPEAAKPPLSPHFTHTLRH
jgi:hypothetical protein